MEIKTLDTIPLTINTKAIIFDCFGTLMYITQKNKPYKFLINYLIKQGYNNKEFAHWLMSRNVSLEDIENLSGIKIDKQAKVDFNNLLQKELNSVIVFPEVSKFLGQLKRSKIKTMLCSNLASTYGNTTKKIVVDNYVLSYEVGFLKPQKEIFQICQNKLNLSKEEIIFVGDNYKDDFLGSKEFGFNSYWLNRK